MTLDPARWHALMSRWGAPPSEDVHARLVAAYSEPHRRYHTARHIGDCLAQLDAASSIAEAHEEVELSLWFHDAVYRPTSSRNELESAEWAASFLRSFGAPEERSSRVCRHILATRHAGDTPEGDSALVADIDLSILGRPLAEFEAYEDAIREEYRWVPRFVYRRKRTEILQSFLDRASIFRTEHFSERFEERARENLGWAIRRLRRRRIG
jgi:predicted metal-dependent HD superfamily phosphohydrolase